MNKLLACRRTFIATLGMAACLALGLAHHFDTSNAIAAIAMGLAAANAGQAAMGKKGDGNGTPTA